MVPRRNGTMGLSVWLTTQRFKRARSRLGHQEEADLEAAGVNWEVRRGWDEMLGLLRAFREERGNCNVPQGYDKVPGLGAWVAYQRTLHRSKR